MFATSVRYVSRHFAQSLKHHSFTRVSYRLSIAAYVLASLAIVMITTILYSLEQFQKQRLLGNTPHVIVTYQQSFTSSPGKFNQTSFDQAMQVLQQDPQIASQLQQAQLYAGGKFFLQHNNTLASGEVVGISDQANEHWWFHPTDTAVATGSATTLATTADTSAIASDPTVTNPAVTSEPSPSKMHGQQQLTALAPELAVQLQPGSYKLVVPLALAINYQLQVGDKVNLINSSKSIYYPSGPVPVSRIFTIAGFYQTRNAHDTWYANLYDIARLNLARQVNQVVLTLYDPLAITKLTQALEQRFGLQVQQDYTLILPTTTSDVSATGRITSSGKSTSAITSLSDVSNHGTSSASSQYLVPATTTTTTIITASNNNLTAKVVTGSNNHMDAASRMDNSYHSNNMSITAMQNPIVKVQDWRNSLALVFSAIKTEARVTNTLTSLLIIIAILSSLITFSFIIVEKDRDVAVLNVLGMPPKLLNQVFLWMVLGLLWRANLISIIIFTIAVLLWPYYNIYLNLLIALQPNYLQIALIYLGCSATIFVATAIAGKFIIKIRPAQVLR